MAPSPPFKTADLFDAHPEAQSCEVQFRRYGRRQAFSGSIRTVRCHEDNALVKQVLSGPGESRVLVVDGGASCRCALLGDVLGSLGVKNGWAGVIVHGAVRDVVALDALELGVKALGSNPRKAAKTGAGELDVPVRFGGATFTPGHWLYSDEDGILVSEAALTGP